MPKFYFTAEPSGSASEESFATEQEARIHASRVAIELATESLLPGFQRLVLTDASGRMICWFPLLKAV